MMSPETKVKDVMTASPHTIGENVSVKEAQDRMRKFKIRHLPVLLGGKLIGVVSERDLDYALKIFPDAERLQVGDAMSEPVYSVGMDTPVETVVREMVEKKYGSAVVRDEAGKTIGVFTTIDGLRLLLSSLTFDHQVRLASNR